MKIGSAGLVALFLFWSGAALAMTFNTPVRDGTIQVSETDWDADEELQTNTLAGFPLDPCEYTLWVTWDETFFFVGLDSDSCRRFLADNLPNLSFFVAIDVDQVFGSGASKDGYGNVNFYGCYMPEYIYYFAGGEGWYEWSYWNGAGWQWLDWRSDNTYYAWAGGGVYDDELGILWSDIGDPEGIAVMAWITDDATFNGNEPGVLAAWPLGNVAGVLPTFSWAYPYFDFWEPMPALFVSVSSVLPDNGEFTATGPTSWGGIKALYR